MLQNQEIERVGSTEKISVDVRIIAAAQSDLRELIRAGKFREDLYHRLAVYPIHIPPLRQREDDIIPLCNHFLQISQQRHQTGKKHLTQGALIMLKNYHWTGNVRELENALERAVIRSQSREINPGDFLIQDYAKEAESVSYDTAKTSALRNFQRDFIKSALARNQGNISRTATEIGISRQALSKIVQDLHLDVNAGT